MSSDRLIVSEVSPPPSSRRTALSLVPFAALIVSVMVAVLWGLTLPSSSPPSMDAVWSAVFVFWLLAIGCLVTTALWATGGPRTRWLLLVMTALLVVGGWRVSGRIDTAWIDACDFGGSGDRCIDGSGSAPNTILAVWLLSGALIGGMCAALAAIGQRAARP